ncbi:PAS domain S-box-containing protein/diguanylate cyclase (GGDEF) domain-containing protein [Thiohalospira halophila DSM 15071]|uniref:PAS domain S-box-containing protein/diguanylate cyclase (GGDEF) domain-containing protein n=1 Tax=Thiohalospira halophila DSM 15071 TaxID=1123397 RepID=A0A1I1WAB4_9GAMM|nr:diguanylate cyclase [Thiohalospira halophila]SFD92116.1 PAS domain S-box-containing protein/diguanylate cyclase (GGDEF) domain-containing protein [Thiohalospira halophila DSM 15071]
MTSDSPQHLSVLLVEDNPADAQLVRDLLEAIEETTFTVTTVHRLAEAQQKADEAAFDVVLLDMGLPDSEGLVTVQAFRGGPGSHLPLVVMTGREEAHLGREALRFGSQDFLRKQDLAPPMLERILLYAVERHRTQRRLELLATAFDSGQAVLIADDQPQILEVNRAFTDITGYPAEESIGHNPRFLSSGLHDEAFYQALWERLKEEGHWEGEVWNRRRNGEVYPQWESITSVADATGNWTHYVAVFHDISEQKRLEAELERLASHDRLTNAYNRHRLYEYMNEAAAARDRYETPFSILMFDLDLFKAVNDQWGHPVGDAVLRELVRRSQENLREADILGRWGGEEFLVIANHATGEEAMALAERLRQAVADEPFPTAGRITVSIGTAEAHAGESLESLEERADRALYAAKRAGRNRTRLDVPE